MGTFTSAFLVRTAAHAIHVGTDIAAIQDPRGIDALHLASLETLPGLHRGVAGRRAVCPITHRPNRTPPSLTSLQLDLTRLAEARYFTGDVGRLILER